jgi:glycosyltransferase involved in cell wall biosynthesis
LTRTIPDMRRPCTLLIGEDAVAHASYFIDELNSRYDLRIVQRPPGAFTRRRELMLREFALMLRLLFSPHVYRRDNIIVSSSGHYAALAISRILAFLGRNPSIFLYNFYLHRLGQNLLVKRILAFLLTRRVVVAGQSQADFDYFRSLSNSVALVLIPYGQDPVADVTDADVRLGDYVFAGGYTNRDYDRLLRCARRLPEIRFVLACSRLNRLTESVPGNVEVQRDLAPAHFHSLLAGARLVVVPLAEDVGSAGQMVTLAAMQLGKPVVVADSSVVTQYVDNGVTGLVYERTSDASLRRVIAAAIADEEGLIALGSAAQARYFERFTKSNYQRSLVNALAKRFS